MMAVEKRLSDLAYERLEHLIVTLKLPPGAVISERILQAQVELGRTPLREALLRLEREQLVRMLPRRGIQIAPMNPLEQMALLEVRRPLEVLIARRAARRASTETREALKELARRMEEETDLDRYMVLDRTFDALVEAACHNRFAVHAVAPLRTLSRRFWYAYHEQGDLEVATERHAALMRTIARGDEPASEAAAHALMDSLKAFTRRVIQHYGGA